jgi:hypothetical protein
MFSVLQIVDNNNSKYGEKYRLYACSACRASKKKCNKKIPICSRCKRLGLECKSYDREVKYFKVLYTDPESASSNKKMAITQSKFKYIIINLN